VLDPPVGRTPTNSASVDRGKTLFLGRTTEKLECAGCHGPQAIGNGLSMIAPQIFYDVVFNGYGPSKQQEYDEVAAFDAIASEAGSAGARGTVPVKKLSTINSAKGFGTVHPIEIGSLLDALEANGYIARKRVGGVDSVELKAKPDDAKLAALRTERDLWEKSLDDWENPLRPANLNLGMYKGGRRPIDIYWRIAKGINGAKMPAHSSVLKPEQIWDLVNFVLALPYEPDLLKDATAPAPQPAPAVAGR
jgi:mono/diheme cytochrome c family protein